MTTPPTDAELKLHAGNVLREAASALHATMHNDRRDWNTLPFQEKTLWGLRVAPSVIATLNATKPHGWQPLVNEIEATAHAWLRSLPAPKQKAHQ